MPEVLLGFDFGMKRIGVAVGQTLTGSAQALRIIPARDGIPDWALIQDLIQEWCATGFVVGIPYHMDGRSQQTTHLAKKFSERLKKQFQLPVYLVDERLTSIHARQMISEHTKRRPPAEIDSLAAKLILESWLRDQYKDQH
jgi:putative Holliday junction resolvase